MMFFNEMLQMQICYKMKLQLINQIILQQNFCFNEQLLSVLQKW